MHIEAGKPPKHVYMLYEKIILCKIWTYHNIQIFNWFTQLNILEISTNKGANSYKL